MKSRLVSVVFCLAVMVVAPSALADTLVVNGACLIGNCQSPTILPWGGSLSDAFNYNFTVNGDAFNINGSLVSNSHQNNTNNINLDIHFVATYEGVAPLAQHDIVTVTMAELFGNPFAGVNASFNAALAGAFSSGVAAGSSVVMTNTLQGTTTVTVGPFFAPGSFSGSQQTPSVLVTDPFSSSFTFTLDFAPGSDAQIAIGEALTPLPGALPLFASGAGVLGFVGWRRKRRAVA